jgi:hypothetical protein
VALTPGVGRIGTMVARKAFALGFKIAACDVADVPDGTERRALADLLASSDVVSLRPPLAAQTRHFIGGAELDLTRPVRPGQHGMRSTVDEERAGPPRCAQAGPGRRRADVGGTDPCGHQGRGTHTGVT